MSSIVKDQVLGEIRYSGEVDAEGQPHGHGEHICLRGAAEGNVYMGQHEHGVKSGLGMLRRMKDGWIFLVQYTDNKRQGVGLIVYPDGHMAHAHYVNDLSHGFFVEAFCSGSLRMGCDVDGKQQGTSLYLHLTGKKEAEEWQAGKLISETTGILRALDCFPKMSCLCRCRGCAAM